MYKVDDVLILSVIFLQFASTEFLDEIDFANDVVGFLGVISLLLLFNDVFGSGGGNDD